MKIEPAFARPEARTALLNKERNRKMARSSHAYVRGSTVKFYEWLDGLNVGALPDGPQVWIEFAVQSTDKGSSHYHSVYRDKKHDYGA